MSRKPRKRSGFTDRDYGIFKHVACYHMTTPEVLHRIFFEHSELNAVRKVTTRLVEHGYLNQYELRHPRIYYRLGPKARGLFGISAKKLEELGPQALFGEYAVLNYCCLPENRRDRLTVSYIHHNYPGFLQKKIDSSHYYLHNDGQSTRLAYMRVDHGGAPDHVIRNCRSDLQTRYAYEAMAHAINTGRFMIAVLTATDAKKKAIEEVRDRYNWPVEIHVEVVHGLIDLM